jgi:hypothetical protein
VILLVIPVCDLGDRSLKSAGAQRPEITSFATFRRPVPRAVRT